MGLPSLSIRIGIHTGAGFLVTSCWQLEAIGLPGVLVDVPSGSAAGGNTLKREFPRKCWREC